MCRELAPNPVERTVAELAGRQYGVVTRRQLYALGLTPRQVAWRLRQGGLHALHRGVYAVGHTALSREADFLAAVLACGAGSALSHVSAAFLWRLLAADSPAVHVTVPRRAGRRRSGAILIHRAALRSAEVTEHRGIPVTSPARTLVDLADLLPERSLERALGEAEFLGLGLAGLEPRHGRTGSGKLRRVLARQRAGSTRTRSELEERFLAICDQFEIPRPTGVNVELEGHVVDFAWPEQRLIVEVDGYQAHGTRRAFERDRLRDLELTAAGWRVVRITWRRLTREAPAVASQLRLLAGPRAS